MGGAQSSADNIGVDAKGFTALHWAAQKGNSKAVAILLRESPNLIGAVDASGCTALHLAAFNAHDQIVAQLLLAKPELAVGADLEGLTTLHYAARGGLSSVVAKLLTVNPGLINIVDSNKCTALHHAAKYGNRLVATQLLAAEPNLLDVVDSLGRTPLHYAASHGREEMAAVLLIAEADITIADSEGWNVLHHAIFNGHERLVEMLLVRQPKLVDKRKLHLAIQRCSKQFLTRLFKWNLDALTEWLNAADCQHSPSPVQIDVAASREMVVEVVQWSMSLEEIAAACPTSFVERFRPVMENISLHQDVWGTIYEYLGFGPTNKQAPTYPSQGWG